VLRRAGQAGAAESKGAGDYVTAVDRESEDAIRSFLQTETPEIPVLAEEGGGDTGERYWTVDPLDGTTNFLHGFPIVGVSVALVEEGRPVAGAVLAPFRDEASVAARGAGAELRRPGEEPVPLRVSARSPEE